jgi:transcriptional regulator with XRE-family HTH domain
MIGDRIREIREQKNLSQADIEARTGLFRCYVSRVENGHTVPSVPTLEKFARALEIPLYQLVYNGTEPPAPPVKRESDSPAEWGSSGKSARFMKKLRRSLGRMDDHRRELLLELAKRMASR